MSKRPIPCVCGDTPFIKEVSNTRGTDYVVECRAVLKCSRYSGPMKRSRDDAVTAWNDMASRMYSAGLRS